MSSQPPRRGGFDPDRVAQNGQPTRAAPVVQQILEAPLSSQARGFTEVRIVGIGGGGSNAVNRMIEADVQGVEFVAVNTDAQALAMSQALKKIAIGGRMARGLGAGGDPQAGERAAEISRDTLQEALAGADMVFITAGMGGGTGTGASPVVAQIAKAERALTVGVVTTPFEFEGHRRRRVAEQGVAMLRQHVDALIVIPNDRLMQLADRQMTVVQAFRLADDVLRQGVQGISDLVTVTGLINLDFADVRTVMANAGTALMAIGESRGEGRALLAARAAISSPLLDASIEGAHSILVNVTGGPDLTLVEVNEALTAIQQVVDPGANIIFGAVINPRASDLFKITLIATGLPPAGERPRTAHAEPLRPEPLSRPTSQPRQSPSSPAEPHDDLDLPAFLRRRRS